MCQVVFLYFVASFAASRKEGFSACYYHLVDYVYLSMAAFLARALYPAAATIETWTDIDNVVAWSGVSPVPWSWVMEKAGAGDAPCAMIVCALPAHVVVDILRQWAEEMRPSYAEQVKVALTFNGVRLAAHVWP